MSDLVLKPKKYIRNEVGYKNESKVIIAIEVFLSKLSLLPDFIGFTDDKKENELLSGWLKSIKNKYKEAYPEHHEQDVLKTLHFFQFTHFAYEKYVGSEVGECFEFVKRVLPYMAFKFIKEKHMSNMLKSSVANTMYTRDQFYKQVNNNQLNMFEEKLDNVAESNAEDVVSIKKEFEVAMILQHRELFEIEQKLLAQTVEHDYLKQYEEDFVSAILFFSNELVLV